MSENRLDFNPHYSVLFEHNRWNSFGIRSNRSEAIILVTASFVGIIGVFSSGL
jgi:hypothetical protein